MKKIVLDDESYPDNLRNISNSPKQLYVLGDAQNLNKKSIAIIGSRNCTPRGAEIAKDFAIKLAQAGACIVSGMAKGIDSQAHLGALEARR